MKRSFITAVSMLLPLSAHAFSAPSSDPVSRRQIIDRTLVGGTAAATFLVGIAPPSLADDGEGYVTTDRGLKYKVTSPPSDPDSPTPVRGQKVKAKYTLYLKGE